jgi:hypothetical protein
MIQAAIGLKVPAGLLAQVRTDLERRHPFAAERIGFLKAGQATLAGGGVLLLAFDYLVVPDEGYISDRRVGARIGDLGFRPARQAAFSETASILHVHLHPHVGRPGPSSVDRRETAHFMPDFVNLAPGVAHAAVILSLDSLSGRAWRGSNVQLLSPITVVGAPLVKVL